MNSQEEERKNERKNERNKERKNERKKGERKRRKRGQEKDKRERNVPNFFSNFSLFAVLHAMIAKHDNCKCLSSLILPLPVLMNLPQQYFTFLSL